MKFTIKRAISLMTAALVTGAVAQAQENQTNLPSLAADSLVGSDGNQAQARPAPVQTRQSTITLAFDVPRESRSITLAQTLPAGAHYVLGSSRLDGKAVDDPKRGSGGTLYWTVTTPTGNDTETGAALRGVLTYDLVHEGALGELAEPGLSVRLPGDRTELIQGKLDAKDLASAVPLKADKAELAENDGAIKLPLAGTVVRIRDRISVTVEAPQGPIPTLTVNGTPVANDLIGTNTQDGTRGIQRLTFVGVPIKAGPNVLRFLDQELTVMLVGGTEKIEVLPQDTRADGSTPIRVKFRTLDAYGQLTDQATVTLKTNLEPRTADANPSETGFQVKLVGGEGVLELQPQSSPTTLKLDVQQGDKIHSYSYEITPDDNRVGVGVVSATLGLNTSAGSFSVQNNLTWQAHAYYEGPLAGGKLYIAADKDKLPTDENTLIRHPVYGDASTESVPLQGLDPVALSYDHPSFRAEYRRNTLPIDVLPVGEQLTALTAYSKSNPQVSGFVAAIPSERVTDALVIPQGNRILHLPDGNISEGSQTLVLAVLERGTGKELKRTTLVNNVDYVLDFNSGVVTLSRALDRVDADLNEQVVYASYRLANPLSKRSLAYGAQVKTTGKNYVAGAAVVSKDNIVTYGARASYDNGSTRAEALLAYSGGVQASASVSSTPNERLSFGAKFRYQQTGYAGLGQFGDGLSLSGNATTKLTDRLSAVVDAEYHRVPTAATDASPISGIPAPDSTQGGSVTARADYQLAPFSVGLGAKYAFGDIYGLGAVGSVGYHRDRVNVDIVHTQPLSGNLNATTDVTSKFKVSKNLNLGFTDKITWGMGQAAALTLDSIIGNVNYAVGYELPTASGAGNRARFSAQTSLPLSNTTALGLRGSALYDVKNQQAELGAGADLSYKTDTISATAGTDLTYNEKGFGVVLRGGITGSVTDHLTLTADGLVEYGQGKSGQRFGLGYAYRNRTLNSLGYVRYVNGSLAGDKPELTAGASAEYRQPGWAVRGGVDSRTLLSDKGSLTWQAYAGGTAYLTEWFGLGAWGRMINQPSTQSTLTGFGVEGSFRALPGAWLTAGYNLKGFEGLDTAGMYSKQGAYLRLDLTLDETLGRKK